MVTQIISSCVVHREGVFTPFISSHARINLSNKESSFSKIIVTLKEDLWYIMCFTKQHFCNLSLGTVTCLGWNTLYACQKESVNK